jgi:hypothetical protein
VKWDKSDGKCVEGSDELEAIVGSMQKPILSGLLEIFYSSIS